MLAYLWRRFVSLRDALLFFGRDDPGLPAGVIDPAIALEEATSECVAQWNQRDAIMTQIRLEVDRFQEADRKAQPRPEGWRDVLDHLHAEESKLDQAVLSLTDRIRVINSHRTRTIREELSREVLTALGPFPFDYGAARTSVAKWRTSTLADLGYDEFAFSSAEPRNHVGLDVDLTITPLIDLYENPRRFFLDVLPNLEHASFREEHLRGFDHLGSLTNGAPLWPFKHLAECLHQWGYGLLLNPAFREIFEKASAEPTFGLILAQAEGRQAFKDLGRTSAIDREALRAEYQALPRGSGDRARWLREKPMQLGIPPQSLERLIRPSAARKRNS